MAPDKQRPLQQLHIAAIFFLFDIEVQQHLKVFLLSFILLKFPPTEIEAHC